VNHLAAVPRTDDVERPLGDAPQRGRRAPGVTSPVARSLSATGYGFGIPQADHDPIVNSSGFRD